jgi:hypothetical protein
MIIPTIIVIIVNKTNIPTNVSVGCIDHHEYSLIKYLNVELIKKINKYTKLLDSLEISSFV